MKTLKILRELKSVQFGGFLIISSSVFFGIALRELTVETIIAFATVALYILLLKWTIPRFIRHLKSDLDESIDSLKSNSSTKWFTNL